MPTGRRSAPGLALLVAETLGQPLDKSMRMTNWKRRPLVQAQAVYAALDAHCLVLLFAAWERERLLDGGPAPFSEMVPPRSSQRTRVHVSVASARGGCGVSVRLALGASFV